MLVHHWHHVLERVTVPTGLLVLLLLLLQVQICIVHLHLLRTRLCDMVIIS